jgi:hypothetical protein
LNDRLVRAGLFGWLAGTFVLAVDVLSFNVLHFAKSSWLASVGYLILGRTMRGLPDTLVGAFGHLLFTGMLGAAFALLIVPEPANVNYPLRGLGLGASTWFVTLSLGTIFRVAPLHIVAWQTALVQLFTVIMWGTLFGWAFGKSEPEVSAYPARVSDQTSRQTSRGDSQSTSNQVLGPAGDRSAGDRSASVATGGQVKHDDVSPALHGEFVAVVQELRRIEDRLKMSQLNLEPGDEPHEEPESWAARIRKPVELEELHPGVDRDDSRHDRH